MTFNEFLKNALFAIADFLVIVMAYVLLPVWIIPYTLYKAVDYLNSL